MKSTIPKWPGSDSCTEIHEDAQPVAHELAHDSAASRTSSDWFSSVARFTIVFRPVHLAAPERREIVTALSERGKSTRAIAPIVGVHHDTVATDIKAAAPVGNPTPAQTVDVRDAYWPISTARTLGE